MMKSTHGRRVQDEAICGKRLDEGHGLDSGDVEALAAADIFAAHQIVGADHVALRFGEAGAIALVRTARELRLLSTNEPSDLILRGLAAVRAGHGVGSLFGSLVEKVTFFHT